MIRQALEACDEVVILSYSNPEFPGCEAARRESWLAALFPETRRLVVDAEWNVAGRGMVPPNDADDATHRRFCGFLCREILGVTVDAVFTSEAYGNGFAAELTRYFRDASPAVPSVQHVAVDPEREIAPVSGTILRRNIHDGREWLSPVVYASFIQRVCLLGGESSGKTTLAQALASEYRTVWVPEYGRELWEQKNGELAYSDMLKIALVQIDREQSAALGANRFLFCDTSPLTTLFYSRHLFGHADPELERLADRAYDLTALCAPDFPFVQDGTRQPEAFRNAQHAWYIEELERRRIPYALLSGSIDDRIRAMGSLLPDPPIVRR